MNAREAASIGLITSVYADEDVLPQAISLAEQLAGFPALQTRLTRDLLRENAGEHDLNRLLHRETDAYLALLRERKRGADA